MSTGKATFRLNEHPHRRFNPLTGEWVLVSPHRAQRPWQGQIERGARETALEYDAECYLCPGNSRAGGQRNPKYEATYVFENDFAALRRDVPTGEFLDGNLLQARSERGTCRVVCFSPRHDLTLARMDVHDIKRVVDTWCDEFTALSGQPGVRAVQIFENRGEMMGCSNAHPHGQIWANETVPDELAREAAAQHTYFETHHASLLGEYLKVELERTERVVCVNDDFAAVVPFWAVWPYETLVISRRCVAALPELDEKERGSLADILRRVTTRYDNLFQTSFPYTMGFHQAPSDGRAHPGFQLHAHFYPPLLRSATIRKFMVGYEMLAMPQRDITAEVAAERLREQREEHYQESK
ncbi:MAG TPA: UDP-glucose--hexose-1-phosphate uridylyltransferase [Dongiaceae bacterium]|nr:UDP-glucose--hexose-1-phosphate uridylyltransferase [Dongiaceae bacterium]